MRKFSGNRDLDPRDKKMSMAPGLFEDKKLHWRFGRY